MTWEKLTITQKLEVALISPVLHKLGASISESTNAILQGWCASRTLYADWLLG